MKAEDTVMDGNRILEVIVYEDGEIGVSKFRRLAEAQAEITAPIFFEEGRKAGMEEEAKRCIERCAMTHQAGRREVVEWINTNFWTRMDDEAEAQHRKGHESMWQAKLKEWGMSLPIIRLRKYNKGGRIMTTQEKPKM